MDTAIKDRTIEFVRRKGLTMKAFEQKCGLSTGYVTSMRKGFGSDKLNNVLTAFPDLNRDWLLYGEGDMLKGNVTQNGNHTQNANGSGITQTVASANEASLITEISEMRKLVQEQVRNNQDQFNRLMSVIDRLTAKD